MYLIIKTFSRLPFAVHYLLADLLYYPLYYLVGYRRKVVRSNLAAAFPEKSATERKAIEKRFYRFFCDNAFESLKGLTMPVSELEKRVVFENPEFLDNYLEQQTSLLLLTNHQCNIEWVVQSVGHLMPCPVTGMYKPLHSKAMDRLVFETRSRFGTPVPIKRTAREILAMRKGFRCMIIAADQSPISREKRYWRPFFHRLAPFYYGPQSVAQATGKPVVFIRSRRLGRGRYSIRFELVAEPPYTTEGGTDVLDRYIERIEAAIRDQPETWWWSNKKWKKPKPGELEAVGLAKASE